jgi:aryl-alcohol dehydrogenase-like predicted oxidoreductase
MNEAAMQMTSLGGTGLHVSALCFGTMTFGGDSDEATCKAVFSRCMDAGINFYDCASNYAGGRSEEILGGLIEKLRHELVITTKFASRTHKDPNRRAASRRSLLETVETSLRRLRTDYIDVLFVHRSDWETDLEETVRALDDLVRQGKILYPAASNWPAWRVMKAIGIAQREGRTPIRVLQPMYNLLKRQAESELLPLAQSEGLGVIPFGPIAGGLLSGKYAGGEKPDVGRLLTNPRYQERYKDPATAAATERYLAFAKAQGYHPVSLAVAWVAANPAVTAPIIGARNPEQLEDSLSSLDIEMTPDLWNEISGLAVPVPYATDRPDDLRS